jgi:AcrR family transcriptional regulator
MPAPSTGKREQKRDRTRERLRRCALARFQSLGFEKTSVADVAADAGVTERTFYRYFPTKEAVLFQDFAIRFDWFRAALDVRPEDESILDSVRIAIESFPDDREVVRHVAELRASLLSGDAIEDHLRRVQAGFAAEIERHLRRRLREGADQPLVAAALGNAIAGALVSTLRVWGEQGRGDTDELRAMTARALDLLRHPPEALTRTRSKPPTPR